MRKLNRICLILWVGSLFLCPNLLFAQRFWSSDFSYEISHSQGSTKKRFTTLQKMIDASSTMTEMDKLERVNQFFNLFEFISDIQFLGQSDYWQTPDEFIRAAAGDCEDFSIAKHFMLLKMGVHPDKLKIVYVKAQSLNQAHMVLAYYPTPDSEPLILDNLKSDILPASKRPDLVPVYSFNMDGLWLGEHKRVGHASRLRKWQDLLNRMEDEGRKK